MSAGIWGEVMKVLSKTLTEADLTRLEYELNIARAKVYKKWGFNSAEIATLLDIPESQVRAALSKEARNV